MTIDQERVNTTKFNIRQALNSAGIDVPVNAPLDSYPALIMNNTSGRDLPYAFQNIIVAGDFEATSENAADFQLYGYDGELSCSLRWGTDAETGDGRFFYDFYPEANPEVPLPSFWGEGDEAVVNGLITLLDLKLSQNYNGKKLGQWYIGEPMSEEATPFYPFFFTL